jgi:hypothetical protein
LIEGELICKARATPPDARPRDSLPGLRLNSGIRTRPVEFAAVSRDRPGRPYGCGDGMESAMALKTAGSREMNRIQRVVLLFGLLLISAVVLGCANNGRVETAAYEGDLERARNSIAEAEQAGAAEFGGPELALARDKLRAAERAAEEDDGERARRLAVEADLDADLAVAIKRNRETQELVTEVRSGLRTLEDELRRGETRELSRP